MIQKKFALAVLFISIIAISFAGCAMDGYQPINSPAGFSQGSGSS